MPLTVARLPATFWRLVVRPVTPVETVLTELWIAESELESEFTLVETVDSAVVIVPMLVVRMFRLLWIPARSVVIVANAAASLLVTVETPEVTVLVTVVVIVVVPVPVVPALYWKVVVFVAVLP